MRDNKRGNDPKCQSDKKMIANKSFFTENIANNTSFQKTYSFYCFGSESPDDPHERRPRRVDVGEMRYRYTLRVIADFRDTRNFEKRRNNKWRKRGLSLLRGATE